MTKGLTPSDKLGIAVHQKMEEWLRVGRLPERDEGRTVITPPDPLSIWNGLCEFEQKVLLGRKTGWGAAIAQACEVLQNRGLFDENYEPTPLGLDVCRIAPVPSEHCICGVTDGFVCQTPPGPHHNRACAWYRRTKMESKLP